MPGKIKIKLGGAGEAKVLQMREGLMDSSSRQPRGDRLWDEEGRKDTEKEKGDICHGMKL